MRTATAALLIVINFVVDCFAQDTKQARIDAAIGSAERVCLVGSKFKFQMDVAGNLTILKLQPGGNAQVKLDRSQATGGVLFENEEVRRLVDDAIRVCMQSEWPRVLRALEGPASLDHREQVVVAYVRDSINFSARRAQEAAEAARKLAATYPATLVRDVLSRVEEVERRVQSKPPGFTRRTGADGAYLEGDFRTGKLNGVGRMRWSVANYYVGEFVDEENTGVGVTYTEDGIQYRGRHRKGLLHGPGCSFSFDLRLCGNFRDGKAEGTVLEEFSEGGITIQRTIRPADKPEAETSLTVIEVLSNGEALEMRYEGEVRHSATRGYGVDYLRDGTRYEGQWDGDRHGFGRLVDGQGVTIKGGLWQQGKLDGEVEGPSVAKGR